MNEDNLTAELARIGSFTIWRRDSERGPNRYALVHDNFGVIGFYDNRAQAAASAVDWAVSALYTTLGLGVPCLVMM